MNNYQQSYENLNTAQRQAVEAIDGPVLVIAGPGTGKTQLLSMRVANILDKTDTDPSNILCLTFTNKAASNMRERLHKLIGTQAKSVKIKTFHALSAEIMNKFPEVFWNGAQLISAPDVVQDQIIHEIISKLPVSNPFSTQFYGVYTMASKAQKSIILAKEAGLTPDKLQTIVTANLAHLDIIEPIITKVFSKKLSSKSLDEIYANICDLPQQGIDQFTSPIGSLNNVIEASLKQAIDKDKLTGKASNTSRWKSSWITNEDGNKGLHKERRRNEWWLALVEIYRDYRDKLHQTGYYDYSDMLLEVIVQIEQNESMRAEIQEQYHYILIDEFQDSNAAQLRLSHLIADHPSSEGKPNIMAVGDDDQSIYAFNGAEIGNLLHFNRSYGAESVETIVLKENYRSTQLILDTSDKIISHCDDRLVGRIPGINKTLISRINSSNYSRIEHLQFDNFEQQLYGVAQDISNTFTSNESTTDLTNKPQQSVAVLARSHKSLRAIASALFRANIPVRYDQQSDILQNEIVKLVIDICRAISYIQAGDQNSLNIALSHILAQPVFDLPHITLWEIATENRHNPDWLDSILKRDQTSKLANWLLQLSSKMTSTPLGIIIEDILGLDDTSSNRYISNYLNKSNNEINSDYIQTLSDIQHLRKLVAEFTPQNEPTVVDLIDYIDTKIKSGQTIPNPHTFVSGNDCVNLLTVHKAKGLEFDTVYIVDATDSNWSPSKSSQRPPANLPLANPLETANDYARLMYVAATRAKSNLVFTSYRNDQEGESIASTELIDHIEKTQVSQTNFEIKNSLEESLRWPRMNVKSEKHALHDILDNFSINVTNLINFLDVTAGGPTNFLNRNLLRLPEAKNISMMHGTAMHSALEFAQIATNKTGHMPNIDDVKQAYASSLSREYLLAEDKIKYTEHGNEIIEMLINKNGYEFTVGSRPEFMISDTFIGEARVGGKLDRIDFLPANKLRIVDYKTGHGLSSFVTKDKNKQIKAWKHKLQIVFYALLAQHHLELSRYSNVEGQMAYVESTSPKFLTLSYTPTDEDMERLSRIITSVWEHVKNHNLPDTSEFSNDMEGIVAFEDSLIDKNTGN
jgi:DNA helicase-2/ATP-dependent DNA helicase PcrA